MRVFLTIHLPRYKILKSINRKCVPFPYLAFFCAPPPPSPSPFSCRAPPCRARISEPSHPPPPEQFRVYSLSLAGFQGVRVQSLGLAGFQGVRVLGFQGFRVSGCQGFPTSNLYREASESQKRLHVSRITRPQQTVARERSKQNKRACCSLDLSP